MKRVIKPYHLIAMLLVISVLIPLMFLLIIEPPQGSKNVEQSVHSAVFSQDATMLLVGGTTTAWLQDPLSGTIIHTWDGHKLGVRSVAISGNNRRAVTGDKNGLFQTWDIQSGNRLHKIQLHTYDEGHTANPNLNSEPIATLSQDGTRLFLRSGHGEVKVVNLDTGDESTITTESFVNDFTSLAVHPNNHHLYTASKVAKTLTEWDAENNNNTRTLNFKGLIKSFAISPDGKYITAGTNGSMLYVIDTETFGILDKIPTDESIEHIHISPDSQFVTINTVNAIQTTYTFPSLHFVQRTYDQTPTLSAMSVNWDHDILLSLNSDGITYAHDLWSGKPVWRQGHFVEPNPSNPDIKRINIAESEHQPAINAVSIKLTSMLDTPIGQSINWDNIPFSEAMQFIENNVNLPLNVVPGIKLQFPTRGQVSLDFILMSLYQYSNTPFVIHKNGLVEMNHEMSPDKMEAMEVGTLDHLIFEFDERFDYYDYHHLFTSLQQQHPFEFKIVRDIRKPITFSSQNPTPRELLSAALEPNNYMYKAIDEAIEITYAHRKYYYDFLVEKTSWKDQDSTKNSIVAGLNELDSIQVDDITDFTPEQFTAWILKQHKPYQITYHVYEKTSKSIPRTNNWFEEYASQHQIQMAYYQNVLGLWNSDFKNKDMTKEEALQVLSRPVLPQNNTSYLQYLNEFRRLQSYTTSRTNVTTIEEHKWYISVDHSRRRIDQEMIQSGNPTLPPQHILSTVVASDHPTSQTFRDRPLTVPWMRYGADWDFFFQQGYYVEHIDHGKRQVYLTKKDERQNENYYVFTLHPKNQAYWIKMQYLSNGRLYREVVCDDFQSINGMLTPASITETNFNNNSDDRVDTYNLLSAEIRESFDEDVFSDQSGKPGSVTK